ncbi:MAG: VTT domain-containing protein, partial [Ramlibacter sp.]
MKKFSRLIVVVLVVLAIMLFIALDLGRFLSLEALKASQSRLQELLAQRPAAVATGYFLLYVAVAALSLPGAALLTIAGGALFGLGWGLVLVSFASSLGATGAFLAARFVLRDSIEGRFRKRLAEVNQGVARDGAFYLFTLRLVPLVPFFVVNLLMGLT